jgi:segregation and condensation protein A
MVDGETILEFPPVSGDERSDDVGDDFDAPVRADAVDEDIDALIVNIDGYEGPLDVLLDLARHQKVDIRRISMVALVDQYLAFVEEAKQRNLELAADYLVMAAWLAYLKSKLLLPVGDEDGDEPTADEMAARLAFQLQRLEAMRNAVEALQGRPQFGIDFFPRGAPEGVRIKRTAEWRADLYDLLRAYTTQRISKLDRDYHVDPPKVYTIEMARLRLERVLGSIPQWTELRSLVHASDVDAPETSIVASAFNAALEFAKDGRIDLRQLGAFEPIYIKNRDKDDKSPSAVERNGS